MKIWYYPLSSTNFSQYILDFMKVYLHRNGISRLDTHPQCSIMDKGYYGLYSLTPKESTISCSIYQSTGEYLKEKPTSLVKLLDRRGSKGHSMQPNVKSAIHIHERKENLCILHTC